MVVTFPENLSASSFDDLVFLSFLKKPGDERGFQNERNPFLANGRTFEVRAVPLGDRWRVRSFEGETAVTVAFVVEYRQLAQQPAYDFVDDLMGRAQAEVERMLAQDVAGEKSQVAP